MMEILVPTKEARERAQQVLTTDLSPLTVPELKRLLGQVLEQLQLKVLPPGGTVNTSAGGKKHA
jgi:hypothetical protein